MSYHRTKIFCKKWLETPVYNNNEGSHVKWTSIFVYLLVGVCTWPSVNPLNYIFSIYYACIFWNYNNNKRGKTIFFFGEYLTIILIHLVVDNNDDIETERRGNCINICVPEYIINKHL